MSVQSDKCISLSFSKTPYDITAQAAYCYRALWPSLILSAAKFMSCSLKKYNCTKCILSKDFTVLVSEEMTWRKPLMSSRSNSWTGVESPRALHTHLFSLHIRKLPLAGQPCTRILRMGKPYINSFVKFR
jgi:hypothetical protein